jgi:CDGSH-type Zn-finger protein
VTRITVKSNGSIRVEGEFTLCDLDGNAFDVSGRSAISLCRCGHSENKPFCDGSHKRVGFESEIKARQLPPAEPKPPAPAAG